MRKYQIPKKDRKLWIQSLESGLYSQGEGVLYNRFNHTYCCLGVFAVAVKGIDNKHLQEQTLPIRLKLELKQKFPKCLLGDWKNSKSRSFVAKLAKMNDRGKSFKEIAKYIRKHTVGV